MRKIKVGELIVDYNLYPRTTVDRVHVGYLKEALASGQTIPPIVCCQKTKRIADGIHRHRMFSELHGPDYLIEVIERRYRNDAELFADAIRLNAGHGKMLTRCDRVHCLILAEKVHLAFDAACAALSMTADTANDLRADRIANSMTTPAEQVALKQTIRHMRGKELTAAQTAANDKLSGMNQSFYCNQLITLIEAGLLDTDNRELVERLKYLGTLIEKL